MIEREIYLRKLWQLKDKDLIKVITGVRRCGKSTLLEAFRNELLEVGVSPENIIFFNFEERDNSKFSDWTVIYDEILSKINSNQIIYTRFLFSNIRSLFRKKRIPTVCFANS